MSHTIDSELVKVAKRLCTDDLMQLLSWSPHDCWQTVKITVSLVIIMVRSSWWLTGCVRITQRWWWALWSSVHAIWRSSSRPVIVNFTWWQTLCLHRKLLVATNVPGKDDDVIPGGLLMHLTNSGMRNSHGGTATLAEEVVVDDQYNSHQCWTSTCSLLCPLPPPGPVEQFLLYY